MLNKLRIFLSMFLLLTVCKLHAKEKFDFKAEVDQIVDPLIVEMEKKYSMHFIGGKIDTGYGSSEKLEKVVVNFVIYRKSSVEEAREILVQMVQKIAEAVNKDKKLQPYLTKSPDRSLIIMPFTAENVDVSLYFRQPDHNYYPNLALASSTGYAGVAYDSYDPVTGDLKDLHWEEFWEAKKILQTHKPGK